MKRFFVLLFSFVILINSGVFSVSASEDQSTFVPFKYYDNQTLSDFSQTEFTEPEAKYAFVANLETGSVIYEKNPQTLLFPASTVKIMTAILAFENILDLDTIIYASENAVKISAGTRINPTKPIKAGEGFTARDLLYALLINGANDAANVLAEHIGGSVDGFCEMMNEKAKELGANNTVFKNPTGLHHPDMKTTAYDMALIAGHAYFINDLVKMSGTTNHTIEATNKTPERRYIYNRNRMIRRVEGETDYFYKGTLGLSAGYTPEGGNCVVAVASRSGLTYLCVVMDAPDTDKENFAYRDTLTLLNSCFDGFSMQKVAGSGKMQCEIPVSLAANVDHVTLYAKEDISALLPTNIDFEKDISQNELVYEDARAPIYEGQSFGELSVTYKGSILLGKTELVATSSVERSNLLYVMDLLKSFFISKWFITTVIIAIILFGLYTFLYYKAFIYRRRFRR